MTVFLLDANVPIALIDRYHADHDIAARWFAGNAGGGWATCPLTENAVLRVVGRATYPNSPGSPAAVWPSLVRLLAQPGHRFWPDSISLLDGAAFDFQRLISHTRLTDSYLLGLAKANVGVLATLDRRLGVAAVQNGREHVLVID